MAEYKMELTGNFLQVTLNEMGTYLPHDNSKALSQDHPSGTDLVIQWVLTGQAGATLALKYKNSRGQVQIVQSSRIPDGKVIFQSGAVFKCP